MYRVPCVCIFKYVFNTSDAVECEQCTLLLYIMYTSRRKRRDGGNPFTDFNLVSSVSVNTCARSASPRRSILRPAATYGRPARRHSPAHHDRRPPAHHRLPSPPRDNIVYVDARARRRRLDISSE